MFFTGILIISVLGMVFQGQAKRLHLGDLLQKKEQYESALYAQSSQGLEIGRINNNLKDLSYKNLNNVQHQRMQKGIREQTFEIGLMRFTPVDTGQKQIEPLPALYDSLVKVVHFTQATLDSIRAVENKISNLKISLNECLEAYKEELARERKEAEAP